PRGIQIATLIGVRWNTRARVLVVPRHTRHRFEFRLESWQNAVSFAAVKKHWGGFSKKTAAASDIIESKTGAVL
ncbi:hypothetical protein K0U00_50595, partial [Paenibacillus sepulcri]|nr:hypothetical protein [Paenibacillus sepulcri]